MLIIVKLLLLIFTVTVSISENQDNFNKVKHSRISLETSKINDNHPLLFEHSNIHSAEPKIFEARKIRDATEISDIPVTNNPIEPKKRTRGNSIKARTYLASSFEEKIPVMVIYDPVPIIQRDGNNANRASVKLNRRKQRVHKQPPKNESKSEESLDRKKVAPDVTEVITERNPVTSTSPSPRTIVPKTFTKRPPEYNPVFKKIRQRDPVVKIVDETNYVFAHSGNFHYSFEGGDGTKVSSSGELKSFENDKTGEAVIGSVFYKDNDGNDVSLSYTADENGYRPHGAHLPTPPPIPPAIARALKYLATATTPEPVTKPTKEN